MTYVTYRFLVNASQPVNRCGKRFGGSTPNAREGSRPRDPLAQSDFYFGGENEESSESDHRKGIADHTADREDAIPPARWVVHRGLAPRTTPKPANRGQRTANCERFCLLANSPFHWLLATGYRSSRGETVPR
jgi:hypothetical protein